MDGGAWWAAVHGVAKSRARLCDFTFTFHFHALEKEMATHSSVLAWRIPGTEEPSGLLSVGSHRVGHDWSDLAAAAAQRNAGRTSRGRAGLSDRWMAWRAPLSVRSRSGAAVLLLSAPRASDADCSLVVIVPRITARPGKEEKWQYLNYRELSG